MFTIYVSVQKVPFARLAKSENTESQILTSKQQSRPSPNYYAKSLSFSVIQGAS
jgi:hypothetical protein